MLTEGPQSVAYVDETSVRLDGEKRLYGLAAVLLSSAVCDSVAAALRELLPPGRRYLHHYDEVMDRRVLIAKVIAELQLDGAVIMMQTTTDKGQEPARAKLLSALLPRLQYEERTHRVIFESRSRSDKHDLRARDRLRQSRRITAELRIDHVRKDTTPLIWLPDFVAGAYIAAQHHGQSEPWSIIEANHTVDVVRLA